MDLSTVKSVFLVAIKNFRTRTFPKFNRSYINFKTVEYIDIPPFEIIAPKIGAKMRQLELLCEVAIKQADFM